MRDEDEIDTPPIIIDDKTTVVFESLELGPGERGEIVLLPDRPLRCPTLFVADQNKNKRIVMLPNQSPCCPTLFVADQNKNGRIVIESIFHGQTAIAHLGQCRVDMYRLGQKLDMIIAKNEPIKIVLINNSSKMANIGASLVDTSEDSTYRLGKEDLKGKG